MEKLDNFDLENLTLIGDEDGIVQVVLSRPAKRNALNLDQLLNSLSVQGITLCWPRQDNLHNTVFVTDESEIFEIKVIEFFQNSFS